MSCLALPFLGAVPAAAQPQTVLQSPKVQIGVADGESEYLLFGARQALRMADGRLVLVNFGTQQIRMYAQSGRHIQTLGGRGDGPGEFRALQAIGLIAGDSIAAYDIGLGRITVFGPEGRVARSSRVSEFGNQVLPRAIGFLRNGGMLVRSDFDRVFRGGSSRDTAVFVVTDALGAPVDTLGRYAGEETFVLATGGGASRRTIAFGRNVHASVRGDRLVIGSSDAFLFDVYFAGGRTRRRIERPHTHQPVTRQDVERANAEWLEDVHPRFREELSRRVREFPHRPTLPAYSDLIAAADGNVWVQHSHVPGGGEHRWTVFDATGRPVRLVRSSLPIVITDAGADYVVAWMRDALGVERVLLFDIPQLQH